MGTSELFAWSRYFEQIGREEKKPVETDWSDPEEVKKAFLL